jgi:3-isopropylmalate dehydrogenase
MKIAILPGDGVGPEVTDAAIEVLNEVASIYGISFETGSALIGGAGIRETRSPLPEETHAVCT